MSHSLQQLITRPGGVPAFGVPRTLLLILFTSSILSAGGGRAAAQQEKPGLSHSQNETLRKIIVAARENRSSGKPAGISVLFTCTSHRQKTAAAEMLANSLGRKLYRVDLNKIVSQYIGETEKNLQAVFALAEQRNSIMFFDEADALFGKRSEVKGSHDRYANLDVNYLLQRIEEHAGIAILSTSQKDEIDKVLLGRFRFAMEFCQP